MTAHYFIADRHTDQSWHERFKKNSAPFARRIKRFIEEGVDRTLKTEKERAKAEQVRQTERGGQVASTYVYLAENEIPLIVQVPPTEAGKRRERRERG